MLNFTSVVWFEWTKLAWNVALCPRMKSDFEMFMFFEHAGKARVRGVSQGALAAQAQASYVAGFPVPLPLPPGPPVVASMLRSLAKLLSVELGRNTGLARGHRP